MAKFKLNLMAKHNDLTLTKHNGKIQAKLNG